MRDSRCGEDSPAPLLTAVDATSQIHLIIGSNPLAAARCTKCLVIGAKPIIISPEDADMHFLLTERIEQGSAQLMRREFRDEDLKTLGREEVDHVVDAVFVTLGGNDPLSMSSYVLDGILGTILQAN
jgi:uroporphyrin-III C-methyltransferase